MLNNRSPRLFVDDALGGLRLRIGQRAAHYLSHVLRLKPGNGLVVFNGRGEERSANVRSLSRKQPELTLGEWLAPLREPELELVLVQSLLKTDAMDLVVQKATELGVRAIYAVKTDFSVIKLDADRAARRVFHWQRVSQSACEQSGRHAPPSIAACSSLGECLGRLPEGGMRIAFHQETDRRLKDLRVTGTAVCLMVGPEGGLSPDDVAVLEAARFMLVGLGRRVLRAETAAIAVCSSAQMLWGDTG